MPLVLWIWMLASLHPENASPAASWLLGSGLVACGCTENSNYFRPFFKTSQATGRREQRWSGWLKLLAEGLAAPGTTHLSLAGRSIRLQSHTARESARNRGRGGGTSGMTMIYGSHAPARVSRPSPRLPSPSTARSPIDAIKPNTRRARTPWL